MSITRRAVLLSPLAGALTACATTPLPRPSATPATGCVTLDGYTFPHSGTRCAGVSGDDPDSDANKIPYDWLGPLTSTGDGLVAWYRSGLVEWDSQGDPVRLLATLTSSSRAYALVGGDAVVPLCDGRVQRWRDGCPVPVLPGHAPARVVAMTGVDDSRFATLGDDRRLHLWHLGQAEPIATARVPVDGLIRLALLDGVLWASSATSFHGFDVSDLDPAGHADGLPHSSHGWVPAPGRRLVGHANALLIAQPDVGVTRQHPTVDRDLHPAAAPDGSIAAVGHGMLFVGHIDSTVTRSPFTEAPQYPVGLTFAADGTLQMLDGVSGGVRLDPTTHRPVHSYRAPLE